MDSYFYNIGCIVNNKKVLFVKYKKDNRWQLPGKPLTEDEESEYDFSGILDKVIKNETNLYIIRLWNIRYEEDDYNVQPSLQKMNYIGYNPHKASDLWYQVCLPTNISDFKINSSLIEDYKWFDETELKNTKLNVFEFEKELALDTIKYVGNLTYYEILLKDNNSRKRKSVYDD